jgi:lactaldehyde dehydrogenase/glycolaldehyde dehydrogenase
MTTITTDSQVQHYRAYINGEWLDSSTRNRSEVQNPATDEVWATVTITDADDVDMALESSDAAQKKWVELPAIERANHLFAICDRLDAERDHFARLLVLEQGKTLVEAGFEVDDTVRYIKYAAEAARRLEGNIYPSDDPDVQLQIHKVPFGVTLALCGFNYPLALIGRKIGPALVTGNTAIIKSHSATPVTASEFCRVVDEAGLPPGVINMVNGRGAEIGPQMVKSLITKLISLTGSTRAGQEIMRMAADNVAGLVLELGGKAPFIVMEDADLDKAIEAAVVSRYANAGQVCICNEMVMVHEKVADEFAERVVERARKIRVGDPMTDVDMGPTVTRSGLDRIDEIVKKNVAQGADLLLGGKRPEGEYFETGNWYEPTVLANVEPDGASVADELFGPIMPITKVSGYEEALARTNNRIEGLSAYLWTNDYRRMIHATNHMEVGTIFINQPITGQVQGYHTGHKTSGIGGEDGVHGIENYLQKRTIYLNHG